MSNSRIDPTGPPGAERVPASWEGNLATEHPNRCRLRDNLLYADVFNDDGSHRQAWRCHKRAGHDGPCSSRNDCGVMNGGVVCGLLPGHSGLHSWATQIEAVRSGDILQAAPASRPPLDLETCVRCDGEEGNSEQHGDFGFRDHAHVSVEDALDNLILDYESMLGDGLTESNIPPTLRDARAALKRLAALRSAPGDCSIDRIEAIVRDGHYSILRAAMAQRGRAGSRIFLEELFQLVREAGEGRDPQGEKSALHRIGVMAMTAQSDPHAEASAYRKALIDICNFALTAQEALPAPPGTGSRERAGGRVSTHQAGCPYHSEHPLNVGAVSGCHSPSELGLVCTCQPSRQE